MKRAPERRPYHFVQVVFVQTSVVAVVPAMPAADAMPTVIGPDETAVRAVIIAIVVRIVAADEEMAAMEVAEAAEVMEAAMTEAATVESSAAVEAVEPSTMESSAMEAATVEATTTMEAAATMAATTPMAAAANLDQAIIRGVRNG